MARSAVLVLVALGLGGCFAPFGENEDTGPNAQANRVLEEPPPMAVQLEGVRSELANQNALNQALARDLMALRQQVNNNSVNLEYLRNMLGPLLNENAASGNTGKGASYSPGNAAPVRLPEPSKRVPRSTADTSSRPQNADSGSAAQQAAGSGSGSSGSNADARQNNDNGSSGSDRTPSGQSSQGPSFTDSSSDPQSMYDQAMQYYRANEFQRAVIAFDQIYRNFPQSELADNALYWTGEVYYQQKDYETAADYFEKITRQYPTGNKAPDAYVKRAYALDEMDQRAEAIDLLMYAVQSFPDAPASTLARQKLEQIAN